MLHALVVDDDMHSLIGARRAGRRRRASTPPPPTTWRRRGSRLEQRPAGRGALGPDAARRQRHRAAQGAARGAHRRGDPHHRQGDGRDRGRGAAPRRLRLPHQADRPRRASRRCSPASRSTRELKQEVSSLRAELRDLGRFGPMVGTSPAMQRVYDLIDKVAPTEATVFLIGESGTGKELVAETVHRLSKRRKGPYLPLNCGAVSPTLIESELFGHEKRELHRRPAAAPRLLRARLRRHAVPRRDHRDADRAAGQAAARAGDRPHHARRRRQARSRSTCG